jgi:hypothetical protein
MRGDPDAFLDQTILNWGPNLLTGKHADSAFFSEVRFEIIEELVGF